MSDQTQNGEQSLTPQEVQALIDAQLYGDTEPSSESGLPNTTQEEIANQEGAKETEAPMETQPNDEPSKTDEVDSENAVVLARDGKHTIPYEKLVQARDGEKHWRSQYESAMGELSRLQAESQERAAAGDKPTVTDNQVAIAEQAIADGFDPEIFGDFSEEDLANGISKLVDMRVDARVEARLKEALAPIQKREEVNVEQQHYNAIYTAHPDLDSIVESQEFGGWLSSQPSIVQDAYKKVMDSGTATQVVELFNTYKASIPPVEAQKGEVEDAKAAAKKVVDAAKTDAPVSLSDLPSGSPNQFSRDERVKGMNPVQMLDEMANWTPEQIESYVNRNT